MLTLPIEIGKRYLRRDGKIVTAREPHPGFSEVAYVGNGDVPGYKEQEHVWLDTGLVAEQGDENRLDLTAGPLSDGWIEWGGGACPVDGESAVAVLLRGGPEGKLLARDFNWRHRGGPGDIVAYRIVATPCPPHPAGHPNAEPDHPSDSKPSNPKDAIGDAKLALHLVSPIVKCYQAIAHWLGNVKYGAWNYRAGGARASVYVSALHRHIDAWWEGQEVDPVDGTPHLANAMACIGILIDAKHSGKLTDDRPPSREAELVKVRAEFEALMPKMREQYKDRDPKHWTIGDDA